MQQLAHLLGADGLLKDGLAAFEVATGGGGAGGHGFFAHVVFAQQLDGAAAARAGAQAGLGGQLLRGLGGFFGRGAVAKVEFQLVAAGRFGVFGQREFGGEGPAGLAAKAFERADAPLGQQRLGFGHAQGAACGRFGDGKAAALARLAACGLARAGVAAVVFLDLAAAVGAGGGERGVVAGHAVAVEFLGFGDDAGGHVRDFAHEVGAGELAALHAGELGFPFAGELRAAEFFHLQAAQQSHELGGLGGGHEFSAFAQHVFFGEQALDDGRARGGRAQAFFLHGGAQLFVVDELARAFHGAQQRGFAVARGRAGLQRADVHGFIAHHLASGHGHERFGGGFAFLARCLAFGFGLFAVDGQPAGLDEHFAVAAEVVMRARVRGGGDARGDEVFGAGEEHRHEAARHQVVELLLRFRERAGRLQRGDDGEVVAHLRVVKNAFAGAHPALRQRRLRVPGQVRHGAGGEHLESLAGHGQIVFGQPARVGAGVGERLVLFIKRLRQRQRGFG